MLTDSDIEWLTTSYPTLKVEADRAVVIGELRFFATYDKDSEAFSAFPSSDASAKGVGIHGSYKIEIKKGKDNKVLPSLTVEISPEKYTMDRHFFQPKNIACLCGPTEGLQFMETGFSFFTFIERFVIPFLYGQSFYDRYGFWPWSTYEHGVAGILQSYQKNGTTIFHAEACLEKLSRDKVGWNRIRDILLGNEKIIGISKCPCSTRGEIRLCHPSVWVGILKLRKSLGSKVRTIIKELDAQKD